MLILICGPRAQTDTACRAGCSSVRDIRLRNTLMVFRQAGEGLSLYLQEVEAARDAEQEAAQQVQQLSGRAVALNRDHQALIQEQAARFGGIPSP